MFFPVIIYERKKLPEFSIGLLSEIFRGKNVSADQCDQIGRFLKVLVNKFAYKISPKILVTFGIFRNRSIYVKTALGYNLGNFWKDLGNFLLQHLGHTAANGKNWAKSGNKKGIKM